MTTSKSYTLLGDLDGLTVAELREWLAQFPDDARLDVFSEPVYQYGGWSDQWGERLQFIWKDNDA